MTFCTIHKIPTFLQPQFFVVHFVLLFHRVYLSPSVDEFDAVALKKKKMFWLLLKSIVYNKIYL